MATVMEMPKLSDTMSEGSVARWLKKEGDKVTAGLPVVEIDTDKATMEYESPAGGVLLKILVGDGQKCALQAPIAVIGKPDEKWQDVLAQKTAKKESAKESAASSKKQEASTSRSESGNKNLQNTVNDIKLSSEIKASPLAKKIASDKGINLADVQGSGPHGRIVQRDLVTAEVHSQVAPQVISTQEITKIPHTNMRKTIARRLTESVHTAPHFFLTISINMTNLLSWRKETLNKSVPEKSFSVNDLVTFLVARALKKHPMINASWQEDSIVQYRDVHISMAVALPAGLVTPVIRNADKLTLLEIAKETKRLATLAKEGKSGPNDFNGGTFSISNLGMSGIEEFTAIINPPQAAILAVGGVFSTPVAGPNDTVRFENRMKVTLSCDHRVIDGAVGAEFLKTLKQYFEDPMAALFL